MIFQETKTYTIDFSQMGETLSLIPRIKIKGITEKWKTWRTWNWCRHVVIQFQSVLRLELEIRRCIAEKLRLYVFGFGMD